MSYGKDRAGRAVAGHEGSTEQRPNRAGLNRKGVGVGFEAWGRHQYLPHSNLFQFTEYKTKGIGMADKKTSSVIPRFYYDYYINATDWLERPFIGTFYKWRRSIFSIMLDDMVRGIDYYANNSYDSGINPTHSLETGI